MRRKTGTKAVDEPQAYQRLAQKSQPVSKIALFQRSSLLKSATFPDPVIYAERAKQGKTSTTVCLVNVW